MLKTFLSNLYKIGLQLWYFYDESLRTKEVLPARVISVGNLTLGGSGKTPLVIKIANNLAKYAKVAVLTRGYGRKSKGVYILDRNTSLRRWEEVGDEPFLIWRKIGGNVPVIVGKDRYETGKIALKNYNAKYLILDDGFQYLPLKRDIDIVCINQNTILRGDYLIPKGTLREEFNALKRAHILIRNIKGDNLNQSALTYLEKFNKPVFVMSYIPLKLYNLEGMQLSPQSIKGANIALLCGIADPNSFIDMINKLGINPSRIITFRDHKELPITTIRSLTREHDYVITTEKDLIKYPSFRNLLALEIDVKIDREEEFFKLL